jgi:hypothetical protein
MKSLVIVVLLTAIPAAGPLGAQNIADVTVAVSRSAHYATPHSSTTGREVVRSYIPSDSPSPGPYVVFGALLGAAVAGLWEAQAASSNGGDMPGTGGLLLIPPVAGALLGGIGGWLVFKIVHSNPTTD